ncbi:hypothetical protein VTN00DRAFT_5458 [Thermoascus crustaceus]|uniref:uncharacterized protein n=1 Tax=Thermoascus crustaceus TaxID=5088 RepID=UPI0037435FBD
MYLVDTFTIYAASAIAANTVVRCIFAATLPLAGPALYARLGLGWGNSLLGFVGLAFAPSSFFLIKHGEKIRTNPRFQPKLGLTRLDVCFDAARASEAQTPNDSPDPRNSTTSMQLLTAIHRYPDALVPIGALE